jgi:hypothetical protein
MVFPLSAWVTIAFSAVNFLLSPFSTYNCLFCSTLDWLGMYSALLCLKVLLLFLFLLWGWQRRLIRVVRCCNSIHI